MALRTNILPGSIFGMLAWQIYGILEYAALTTPALLRYSDLTIAGWHWKYSFFFLTVYSLVGLLLGAGGGLLITLLPASKDIRVQLRAVGTLTLVVAFTVNVALGSARVAAIALALLIVLLASMHFSELCARRFSLIANPWISASILVVTAFIVKKQFIVHSAVLRLFLIIACVAVVALASMVLQTRLSRPPWGLVRLGGSVILGFVIVFGSAAWLSTRGVSSKALTQTSVAATQSGSSRPNVVLVTMDTVRADHLSLYGYSRKTSPNLDALAKSASVFAHPVAASDNTLVSHAAIFTGAYAHWTGVWPSIHPTPISRKFPVLAEILASNGYATAGFAANYGYFSPQWEMDRGFHILYSPSPVKMFPNDNEHFLRFGLRRLLNRVAYTGRLDSKILRGEDLNRRAFSFLESLSPGQPFFLFLNYMDAHDPYTPPPPYDTKFSGRDSASGDQVAEYSKVAYELRQGRSARQTRAIEHLVSQYDGGIAYLDDQLGKLISRLRDLGYYDNTLIVITADHGEGFWVQEHRGHGYLGHGITVYEDQVFVPLVIKYPHISTGQFLDIPVGQTDILPTISDVAGIRAPSSVQGRSVRNGQAPLHLMSEALPSGKASVHPREYWEWALYSDRLKFIESTAGKLEMYDWKADPAEIRNLCPDRPQQCFTMQHQLDRWLATTPKLESQRIQLDKESQERLKSLGYIGH